MLFRGRMRLVLAVGVAGFFLIAVALPRLGVLPLGIIGGYEGGRLYFYGVKTSNPYSGTPAPQEIVWRTGEASPSYSATWQFSGGRFNLDPYGTNDYWQNLIGVTDGNGQFEKDAFGRVRADQVDFTETVEQTAEQITKRKVEAAVYYADVDVTLQTDVDESFWTSEKDDPWRATQIIMNVQVVDYQDLPGDAGNETNWSTLLGVEVVRVEKLMGEGDVVMLDFQAGQMIPMYSEWADFTGGREATSEDGEQFISQVTYKELVGAQIPVVKSALVGLGFSAFGTEPSSFLDEWREPQIRIVLRIHILKVGSWLITQKLAEDFAPPVRERPEGEGIGFPNPFAGLFDAFGDVSTVMTWAVLLVAGSLSLYLVMRGMRRR